MWCLLCPEKKRGLNKRGQITLFVVLALVIVAGFLVYFLLLRKPGLQRPELEDPQSFIDACVQDALKNVENILLSQGGYLAPQNYKLYDDQKVAYLCYTSKYYEACNTQEPLYIQHLENEMEDFLAPRIDECFRALRGNFEKRNYVVEEKVSDILIGLEPRKIKVSMERYLKLSKQNQVEEFQKFSSIIQSPLYDLGLLAGEIASQEARFCDFEYLGYMLLHPEVEIEKKAVGGAESASKIYILGDRATGKKLFIAIRSCAIPPGF